MPILDFSVLIDSLIALRMLFRSSFADAIVLVLGNGDQAWVAGSGRGGFCGCCCARQRLAVRRREKAIMASRIPSYELRVTSHESRERRICVKQLTFAQELIL